MAYRSLMVLVLFGRGYLSVVQAQQGFTVAACYSEIPNSSCSPVEAPFHSPTLEGPIPSSSSHGAEFDQQLNHRFANIIPGNYILRTDGCNPFGCWLDTPVVVVDADVAVRVQQIGPQTPTPAPQGARCGLNSQCATGYCSSGVCCNQPCRLRDEYCDEPGREGECLRGPTPILRATPTPTTAVDTPCLGDGNADHRVTIDELVGAVVNALAGCP